VRMLQSRGGLDLPSEPVGAQGSGQLWTEDLQGDGALVLEVLGQVHRRHAPAAKLALEHVPVLQGSGQGLVGHVWGVGRTNLPWAKEGR